MQQNYVSSGQCLISTFNNRNVKMHDLALALTDASDMTGSTQVRLAADMPQLDPMKRDYGISSTHFASNAGD